MLDLLRLLKDQGVAFRPTIVDRMQVRTDCPMCHGFEKLWLCIDREMYYCHKCQWTPYDADTLLKKLCGLYGMDLVRAMGKYQKSIDGNFEEYVLGHLADIQARNRPRRRVSTAEDPLVLPEFFVPLGDPRLNHKDSPVNNYALTRGFSWQTMVDLGFGGCYSGDDYKGYLILPAWEEGVLKFWQGRDSMNRGYVPRYRTPKGYSSSYALFNIDVACQFEEVALCEGVFSGMRTGPDAVGTFGNKISLEQIEILLKHGVRKVVVCFDPDSWFIPKAVFERPGGDRARAPIIGVVRRLLGRFDSVRIVPMAHYDYYKDPDDWGTEKMRWLIVNAGVLLKSEMDLVFLMKNLPRVRPSKEK